MHCFLPDHRVALVVRCWALGCVAVEKLWVWIVGVRLTLGIGVRAGWLAYESGILGEAVGCLQELASPGEEQSPQAPGHESIVKQRIKMCFLHMHSLKQKDV